MEEEEAREIMAALIIRMIARASRIGTKIVNSLIRAATKVIIIIITLGMIMEVGIDITNLLRSMAQLQIVGNMMILLAQKPKAIINIKERVPIIKENAVAVQAEGARALTQGAVALAITGKDIPREAIQEGKEEDILGHLPKRIFCMTINKIIGIIL
jgi:hypothetical protein